VSAAAVPLQAAQLDAATALLAAAFVDDVGMHAICGVGGTAPTRRSVSAWFRATLRVHLATGQPTWAVSLDARLVGVALLTTPAARWVPHAWLGWMAAVGTQCGWSVVWRTAQHDQRRAAFRPTQPHGVLEFITVRADERGQGLGNLLLEAAHAWSNAQPEAPGIWLETTRPALVPWYERLGYRVTGQMPRAYGDAWCLFRVAS
jgi:GNAT superfamily N-acetyltransferase